jgi:hypothetical protein
LLPQIFYLKLELPAINELYRMSRRNASALSLYFTVLLLKKMVKLYSIVLLRCRQLASSRRKNNKLKRLRLLLKPKRSFSINYRRKRRGV